MIHFEKVNDSTQDNVFRRILKTLFGRSSVSNAFESSPFGLDSNPLLNDDAIVIESLENGKKVVLGYINKNQIAGKGEIRLYSLNSDREEQNYLWIKSNGDIEVGGDSDNMVRYSKLETAFNELKDDFNNHVQKWNIFATAYIPGGPVLVGTPPTASTSSTSNADISQAKIDEIKTS